MTPAFLVGIRFESTPTLQAAMNTARARSLDETVPSALRCHEALFAVLAKAELLRRSQVKTVRHA